MENEGKTVRKMVEDITVTPFFKRHTGHMPATIKLHADITEDDRYVRLRTEIPGFREGEVDVNATVDAIEINLHSGKGPKEDDPDIALHSAYFTPSPIDPDKLEVSHEGDVLEVRVPKVKK